jgi:hypothetical protein
MDFGSSYRVAWQKESRPLCISGGYAGGGSSRRPIWHEPGAALARPSARKPRRGLRALVQSQPKPSHSCTRILSFFSSPLKRLLVS